MKKVLTLVSALSMVAGSAFAHDYSWSVGKTPTTDVSGSAFIPCIIQKKQ